MSGIDFFHFWSPGQKISKSRFLGLILAIPRAKAKKPLNRDFWVWFCWSLEPALENHYIATSGIHSADLWTRVAKSSNQESWDWLCRFLEPKPQSHQIDISRIHFVNVWKQGIKISKSRHWFFRFLAPKLGSHEIETAETNFPPFGATARKLSNREFGGFILSDFATIRDWFLLSGGGSAGG